MARWMRGNKIGQTRPKPKKKKKREKRTFDAEVKKTASNIQIRLNREQKLRLLKRDSICFHRRGMLLFNAET